MITNLWLTPPIGALKPGAKYFFYEDFSSQYSLTIAQNPSTGKFWGVVGEWGGRGWGGVLRAKILRIVVNKFFLKNHEFSMMSISYLSSVKV